MSPFEAFAAWWLKKFGFFGTAIMIFLAGVVLYLSFVVGWQKVTGYFDRHDKAVLTTQRDTQAVRADKAEIELSNESKSAGAATEARDQNDENVGKVRDSTRAAVERATHEIESTPVVPVVRSSAELHDDTAAVGAYRAAASRLRRTRAR